MQDRTILRAAATAAALAAAIPASALAQSWYTTPSSWYVGAAGGPSRIEITCDAGNCDRASTAWKLYGGFRFPNRTGAELAYVVPGTAHADALHHLGLGAAKVDTSYLAAAGVWAPELGGGFTASAKLGLAVSMARSSGTPADASTLQGGADRTRFPHVYAAAGLGWKPARPWTLTADVDWSRISYRNRAVDGADFHLKQTVDAGTLTFGALYEF